MSTPWFRAEYHPVGRVGNAPTVDLIRKGSDPTGNPSIDCWADTGCVYGLSLADAVALHASLGAAIAAASPKEKKP
jgi:hypothetical protein